MDDKRLRAVVNRLPKTADGAPIVYGDKVWYIDPCGFVQGLDVVRYELYTDIGHNRVYQPCGPLYSTADAAHAAKKEQANG